MSATKPRELSLQEVLRNIYLFSVLPFAYRVEIPPSPVNLHDVRKASPQPNPRIEVDIKVIEKKPATRYVEQGAQTCTQNRAADKEIQVTEIHRRSEQGVQTAFMDVRPIHVSHGVQTNDSQDDLASTLEELQSTPGCFAFLKSLFSRNRGKPRGDKWKEMV